MLLAVFNADRFFVSHSVLSYMVLDFFVIVSCYFILSEFKFFESIIPKRSLNTIFRRKQRLQFLKFNMSIANDLLRTFALLFGVFWILKWWSPGFDPSIFDTKLRTFSFLDSFIFTSLTVYLLDPDRSAKFFKKIEFTSARVILLQFAAAILFGAILLLLPISTNDFQKLEVIDAIFLSVSALSVTGLSPVDISIVLSKFGQIILLILIQLGGLGVIVLTIGISAAVNRKLSISQMRLSQSAFENCFVGDASTFLSRVVGITLLIEAIGAAWIYMTLPEKLPDRFFVAVFHSISAFCNAGFSTLSANLADQAFSNFGLAAICILIIFGGIGFPVIIEISRKIRNKNLNWIFLSPQTKLVLVMSGSLLLIGFVVFVLFQLSRPSLELSGLEIVKQAAFYSVSSRTAGFNLIPVEQFSLSIQFLLVLLMFIGASPSSTGGGVKTSTIGVILAMLRSTFLQLDQTHIFSRTISDTVIQRAVAVSFLYMLIAGIGLLVLAATETVSFSSLLFETFSALSTVGLSMGATANLSAIGKMIIMFFMIFGRVGLVSIVNAGIGNLNKSKIQFPKENFYVG